MKIGAKFSRKLKTGITFFYGQFLMPFLPFTPNVSLCLAPPLSLPPETSPSGKKRTKEERIEELHKDYIASITRLFDHYKAEAGYPHAKLEVV